METIIYLIRHAEKLTNSIYAEYDVNEPWKSRDEKKPLTSKGEKMAYDLSCSKNFDHVSVIYSSHYSRCISTAKYLSERLGLKINVSEKLQERLHGEHGNIKPATFYYNQHHDFDYRLPKGESLNDTKNRMIKIINDIVFTHHGKEVAIFTHEYAIIAFLIEYCQVAYNLEDELVLSYNANNFTLPINSPEIIKVTFNDNKLTNIQRIDK